MLTLYYTWFLTIVSIMAWGAASVWIITDAEKLPEEAWTETGESRKVWTAIAILLAWPVGLVFYLLAVRRPIKEIAQAMEKEEIYRRAYDEAARSQSAVNRPSSNTVSEPEKETSSVHQFFDDSEDEANDSEYPEYFDGETGVYDQESDETHYSECEDCNCRCEKCDCDCSCARSCRNCDCDCATFSDSDDESAEIEDPDTEPEVVEPISATKNVPTPTSSMPVVYPPKNTRIPPMPTRAPRVPRKKR